ncbi:MFS transporter [Microlunatus spumicola]|uniref:MFS transporter n=1 Tax=Microlunatus spumicola TaxID=81499 RepID=A0ABP6XZN3_9ACTN
MVAVVLVAAFMDLVDVTIVAVAAPSIRASLGASPSQVQWTVAAYALSLGAALVTGGRLGDAYGRRRAFLGGLAVFVVASAACALAPTAGVLVATRVVQGLGAGVMVPQVFGIIRSSLDPRQTGAALGAYGAVQGLASIAGPLLGGLLVTTDLLGLGWRTVFWVNVPIGLVALAIGWRVLPESRQPGPGRLDLVGAGLLAGSLVLVLLPLVQGGTWGWPVWGWVLLLAGVVGLAVFLGVERGLVARGAQPVLDPRLLADRGFSGGLAASATFFGGIASFFLLLSVYLQEGTGRSALTTGLVTLPYALGSLVTSGLGVALAARHGRRLLITGSLVIAASHLGLWWVVGHTDRPTWWQVGAPLLVGGLGLGLAAPPLVDLVLAAVPRRAAGAAAGVLSTVNQVAGALGVAALGALFFTRAGRTGAEVGPGPAYAEAFAAVLPWQVGLYVVAAGLMTLLPRGTQPPGGVAAS